MSRQIIDASVIDAMLKQRGITPPKAKLCCGRTQPAAPVEYARYLKQLGYTGDVAVRTRGVITELVHIR